MKPAGLARFRGGSASPSTGGFPRLINSSHLIQLVGSILPELDENLGPRPEGDDGRRKSSKVPRRWLRPPLGAMASLRGCAMVEFGSHPNIRRGMSTHDGDFNLLFILVVSTLVYFNARFLSHM